MVIRYYATEADIRPVLADVEAVVPLRYSRQASSDSGFRIEEYLTHSDIDSLGCPATYFECHRPFLLHPAGTVLRREEVRSGVFRVDQLLNPETVVLVLGGNFLNRAIVQGSVGSAYKSSFAQLLTREFRKSLRRRFVSVGGVFVGPEALEFYRRGGRLTPDPEASAEIDFRIPAAHL